MITACAACASSPGGGRSAPPAERTIVWGKQGEPDLLDPAVAPSSNIWEILNLVYERLVGLDDDLRVVPELAESWQQTSPATYVFKLRKGVRFSNGRELTADDVAGTLDRVMDPETASIWGGQLGIRKVTASGPLEVTVTLEKPRATFVPALAASPAAILPMKELGEGTFDPKKELLGTGPYKLTSHSQAESWTFERNPHYWRPGRPIAGKVTARILPDDAARVAALRDGGIDVATFESPDSVRLLRGQADVKTVVQSTTDYYNVSINSKSSLFRDDRLRQALALSIDREKIRNVALAGIGRSTAATPVALAGACDPSGLPFTTPNVEQAKSLVEAVGATGETFELSMLSTVPMSKAIAQVLHENLTAIGLKPRIVTLDPGQRAKESAAGDFDAFVSWFAGYADPAMVLAWWNPEVAGWNKTWVTADDRLNELIDKSLSTTPGPERARHLRQACERIAQDSIMIPLVTKETIVAYRADKLDVRIQRLEGYGVPLRRMADFGVR